MTWWQESDTFPITEKTERDVLLGEKKEEYNVCAGGYILQVSEEEEKEKEKWKK